MSAILWKIASGTALIVGSSFLMAVAETVVRSYKKPNRRT